MKAAVASVVLFVAGVLADFMINTPSNVVECEPTLLNWQGGRRISCILPGATPNGNAIESFPPTNSTSLTWVVNIESNTSIGFTLRDSTGAVAQTASVVVQAGSSNACLSSTSISAGPTASPTDTSGGSSTAASSDTGASTGASSAATSTSTSTSRSGASANAAQFGVAGIVGAAVAAFFL